MKLLTFSSLYPDVIRPRHGVFVENRLRHLLASGRVESVVVAPVPWFPFSGSAFGRYAELAEIPRRDLRHGIEVLHPRYPAVPKVGMTLAPWLMALAVLPTIKGIQKRGYDFAVLDAHYFYPDGVAAAILGALLGKPVVITGRGTDLNFIPRYRLPRAMIRWAAARAAGLVTVCEALKEVLVELGVEDRRIVVLRNGVDLRIFRPPEDRAALRDSLGLTKFTLISVGHLIPRKGHDIVLRMLESLDEAELLVVGEGPQRGNLVRLARSIGCEDRVRFIGEVPHEELHRYYGVADALVLASDREGWANILLESMACGTPVVATKVWGAPEIVREPEAGVLVDQRTPEALVEGVERLNSECPSREATRRYAEQFSWDATTRGQLALLSRVLEEHNQ